jgi:hypothetical protein
MSLLSVVKDVCLAVGVNPLQSMFASSIQPRTQAEMLSLANEMAQRIAYTLREWTALKVINTFTGDGIKDRFPLPANYERMLLTSQVYPSWTPTLPLNFISDSNEWVQRRLINVATSRSEWTLIGTDMLIYPVMGAGKTVTFIYLDKNCVRLFAGGYGDEFQNDLDQYRLNERLLKLGMIWQWKANKGSPYAEDMGTFIDALMMIGGADKPSPIFVDRVPISRTANVALPWPTSWGVPAP